MGNEYAEQICLVCGAPAHVLERDGDRWVLISWCGDKIPICCRRCWDGVYHSEVIRLAAIEMPRAFFSIRAEDMYQIWQRIKSTQTGSSR